MIKIMAVRKIKEESGQIALIIILMVVVIAVIVLSVASRSITEVRMTRTEEEAARALKIAETGVEEALSTLSGNISQNLGEGSYSVTAGNEGADGFASSGPVDNGEAIEVMLGSGAGSPTSLDIYFVDTRDSSQMTTRAAVEISVYNESGGVYSVKHYGFDPVAGRVGTNKFTLASTSAGNYKSVDFGAVANLPLVNGDKLVRIKALYNKTTIGVKPLPDGSRLPDQKYRVVSTGKIEGDITRAVEVQRDNPALPAIFDNALYSGSALNK